MYPVSGHRNGAVDYTYMFAIDTKYNTAVADYTVVIQSTVNTLIPAGARVFEYSHNQTPIAPGYLNISTIKQTIEPRWYLRETTNRVQRTAESLWKNHQKPDGFSADIWLFSKAFENNGSLYIYIRNGSKFFILAVTQQNWVVEFRWPWLSTLIPNLIPGPFHTKCGSALLGGVCFVKMECPLRPGIIKTYLKFLFYFSNFPMICNGYIMGVGK